MPEFTPGAWEFVRLNHFDGGHPYATTFGVKIGSEVIEIYSCSYDSNPSKWAKEWGANARLLAASPEMFEALAELHKLLDFDQKSVSNEAWTFEDPSAINEAFEKALRALAKAKGEAGS